MTERDAMTTRDELLDLLRECRAHIERIERSYFGDKRSTVAGSKLLARVDAALEEASR